MSTMTNNKLQLLVGVGIVVFVVRNLPTAPLLGVLKNQELTDASIVNDKRAIKATSYRDYFLNGSQRSKDDVKPPYFPPLSPVVQSPDYDPTWKLVSKSRNLFVNYIPKVMCSSIRDALNAIECNSTAPVSDYSANDADKSNNTLDERRRLVTKAQQQTAQFCAQAKYAPDIRDMDVYNLTRVVMFRDPFERLYSAWRNSAVNPWIFVPGCHNPSECSFDTWVQRIDRNRDRSFRNEHFRPQVEIAQLDKMHYHYYLRFSSAIDQEFFWKHLVRADPVRSNSASSSKAKDTTQGPSMPQIRNETMRMIAEIYKNDLLLWETLLQRGTPRQEEELSLYDYYKAISAASHD